MTTRSATLLLCALCLTLPTLAPAQTDACRQLLNQQQDLRQLYARGDGMAVQVVLSPGEPQRRRVKRVYEVTRQRLEAHGLYDPDAPQWLEINVTGDAGQFAILMSLRRWTDDLGYGLPGESTVWVLGGGGRHGGRFGWVLAWVGNHVDEFIRLYRQAQRACTM